MLADSARINSGVVADFIAALLLVLAAAASAELIHALLGLNRLSILFLAAVTATATIRGSRASLFAAVLGVIFYKLFLDLRTEAEVTLAEHALNLLIFLIVALVTGTLAGRMHDEAEKSRRRADRTALLLKTSRGLGYEDEAALWAALAQALAATSGADALVFDGSGKIRCSAGSDQGPGPRDLVRGVIQKPVSTIKRDDGWSALAIIADEVVVGVLAWQVGKADPEIDGIVELLSELAAAAFTRMRAREEQIKAAAANEAARLRETILSSISHDFRSPLAAIIGSATSLLEYGDRFDPAVRRDLLLNIHYEGDKLNDFVTNLLNVSRLQAGVIEASRQHVATNEVVSAAIDRVRRHRGETPQMVVDGECVASADPLLLEQAVYNILDNAVKYAGSSEGVEIRCLPSADGCEIVIADHGPGISKDEQAKVFTKFWGMRPSTQSGSAGLGLFIAKGFVEAIGGSLEARDRTDGASGLEMAIHLRSAS